MPGTKEARSVHSRGFLMVTYEGNQEQIRRLAAYLRHNPGALAADPEVVAKDCGVDIELVRRSLSRGRMPAEQPAEVFSGPTWWNRFTAMLARWLDAADRRLLWVVGISFFVACSVTGLMNLVTANQKGLNIGDALSIIFIVGSILLHFVLYFRRGFARYAFWGGLIVWLTVTAFIGFGIFISNESTSGKFLATFAAAAGFFFLAMMYSGAGAAFALVGAYRVVRDEERTQRNRSRQELIERMFQIEELLGQTSQVETEDSWMRRFLNFGQRNIWVLTVLTSLVLSVLAELLGFFAGMPRPGALPGFAFTLVALILGSSQFLSQVLLSFMGGRPVRSIFVSMIYAIVQSAVGSLPFFRRSERMEKFGPYGIVFFYILTWCFAVVIGLFAGIGAQVEERAYRRRRLAQNDPQMLLNELIEIQRTLNPDTSLQYVMVVDAARSSVMKANADPLQAEWSFREYQKFLARIVESNGGRIHSTAGDGAVAIFNNAPDSFNAAREIQSKIFEFNSNVNRLKDPFRLRIGIHCDTVTGDLEDVQFAAVIDIAAHVEGASQVGGIAVTQPITEKLEGERFAVLSDLVDGYQVSMALNPTLDPEADGL